MLIHTDDDLSKVYVDRVVKLVAVLRICWVHAENQIYPSKDNPVLGKRLKLECPIEAFSTKSASWAKDSDFPATICDENTCSTSKSGRYEFSSNSSGIFITIDPLREDDFGLWKCTTSASELATFKLDHEKTLYPPKSCWISSDLSIFCCKTSCTNPGDQLEIYWKFNDQGDLMFVNDSECIPPATAYSSSIMINNSPFNGKGTLSCVLRFRDYPDTEISSFQVWTALHDCNCTKCVVVAALHCVCFCVVLSILLLVFIIRMMVNGLEKDDSTKQNVLQCVWKHRLVGLLYACLFLVIDVPVTVVICSILFSLCSEDCICRQKKFALCFGLFVFVTFWMKIGIIIFLRKKYNSQRKRKRHKVEDVKESDDGKGASDSMIPSGNDMLNDADDFLENGEENQPDIKHEQSKENQLADVDTSLNTTYLINRDEHVDDIDNPVLHEKHSELVECIAMQKSDTIQPVGSTNDDRYEYTVEEAKQRVDLQMSDITRPIDDDETDELTKTESVKIN